MQAAPASPYQWRNIRRSELASVPQSRRLRWWILLALICSLVIHVLLILWFSDIRILLPAHDRMTAVFRIPRSEISPESLRPPLPDTNLPDKLDPNPDQLPDAKLDLQDLQRLIPDDREIKLTPEVTQPENLAPGGRPAAGEPIESLDPAALDSALETVSTKGTPSLEITAPLSLNQPVILTDPETIDGGKSRDLLDKAARGNEGLADRYQTLDDAIGIPGGKLTDINKPIYMPTDLLFDYNESRLREGAKTSLMMLGVLIDRNPETLFVIEGHTDTIGGDQFNLDLSRRRAEAVRDWLQQSLRLDPARLQVEACGETRPLTRPDGTVEQQQPNRRVEIRMRKPGTGDGPRIRAARPVPEP